MSLLQIDISDIKTKTPLNVLTRLSSYQQAPVDPSLISAKLEKAAQHKVLLQERKKQQKEENKQRKAEAREEFLQKNMDSSLRFKLHMLTNLPQDHPSLQQHL